MLTFGKEEKIFFISFLKQIIKKIIENQFFNFNKKNLIIKI
jgi:hypothetical protein